MTRLHVLTSAAISWPLTWLYWIIPSKLDFPFFFTLLCLAVIYFMDAPKEEMTEDEFIGILRIHAVECCQIKGSVTTDDLRKVAELSNMTAPTPQTWSKILKPPLFARTGVVMSPTYRRKIGVYKLAGENGFLELSGNDVVKSSDEVLDQYPSEEQCRAKGGWSSSHMYGGKKVKDCKGGLSGTQRTFRRKTP